ncbi:hypothetical protein DBV05_g4656 [Lasiodiplodia theobromae]|uniref:Uncharacterized protein n=1 Tax=Lasiodiplodia theobromae TaxID=45133 RepID=A0A5N5DI91_9PEZI|nr:hypothetical protein DBV05_g4656 [Lasiodiplodia theobromae]
MQRFSAIPNKFSADGNKRASTVKPASNPFSFNNYAFRPAPQPSAPNLPVDPAELTRRLERYLASLEPGSDAAAPPARPSAISRQASSSSVTAARHAASSGQQQQSRNGANQPLLNPRTKSATASAHSPASPNTGTAASLSKKSSHAALNNGNTALLASSRAVAESLPYATAPRSNEDLVTLEALRQEARRATRRSLALHASKGLNAPVAAGELARRLNALAGSGAVNSAGNNDPLLALKSSSPVTGNGNVKRSSSARANEKRVCAPGTDLRKSSSMRLATLELELEKMRTKEAHGSRRSTRRSMPLVGADADQLWRVYVSTQRGTNTQAMAPERQQKSVRKSASARRARPTSTSELDVMRGNGGKTLQKSRSTGCVEGSDGTQANGELGKSGEHVFGRRPDWSQRDEMEKFSSHHPLHLHVPGLGRNSLTTDVPSGDERGFALDGERKRTNRTPEMKTSHRQSVRVADVSKRASSPAAPARRGPPQLPALLHIPSLHSSDEIITLQQAPSSSSPLSPTTVPSPSITLSPVDSSDTIPMHPGFGPTKNSTNPLVSMRTSSSPTLPPLRRSSSFEARIPQHLFYSSEDGQLHGEQSPHHHSFPGKASGMAAMALEPLPEISPLPAPDRFSKKRPSMAPRQKSSSTTVTTTSTGQRSTSATKTTASAYAATNKARGKREYGTVMSPVSASAPSSVPWPGPSQGRGARVMVGGGVGRPAQHQLQQHQRGVVREKRSQSAMEMRGGDEHSNNGHNNNKTLGRRKSVAFVSNSYPASASADASGRGVGPQGRETSSGGPTTGIQRSSTLPVKGKVGEDKDAEGHAAKNSTRLVFWRRDSGKAVDEAMLSGGEEHHILRSPSRLAFWKKGK